MQPLLRTSPEQSVCINKMTLGPGVFGGKAFAGETGGGGGGGDKTHTSVDGVHSTTWQFGGALLRDGLSRRPPQRGIPQLDTLPNASDNLMPATDKIYPCSHEWRA